MKTKLKITPILFLALAVLNYSCMTTKYVTRKIHIENVLDEYKGMSKHEIVRS